MIDSVKFIFGSSLSAEPLIFDPRPITVFVGPNNSGKSLALREIESWCKMGMREPHRVVAEIGAKLPDAKQALAELEPFRLQRLSSNQAVPEGHIAIKRADPLQENTPEQTLHVQTFSDQWNLRNWNYVSQYYLTFFTLRLDGRTRFSLTQHRPSGTCKAFRRTT